MCELEEFLRNHNLLDKYLKNVNFMFRNYRIYNLKNLTIQHSFRWADTKEGYDFWLLTAQKASAEISNDEISIKRIKELRKKYKLIPPRYKEVL